MVLAEKIRNDLKRKHLSQKEAADIIGMPGQNLSSTLQGKRDFPLKESLLLDELLGYPRGYIQHTQTEEKIQRSKASLAQTDYITNKRKILELVKENGGLWSYDSVPYKLDDDTIIEEALLHLQFEDMGLLFNTWSFVHIKRVWKQRLLPQRTRLNTLNTLLYLLFFQ